MNSIFKFLPYDALYGHKKAINDVTVEFYKIAKPELSEDQIIEINNKLIIAIQQKKPVQIMSYFEGFIKKNEGFLHKIDANRVYFTKANYLNKSDIIDIEFMI